MLWNDVGFLLRSKIARNIMEYMKSINNPVMPSKIAKAIDMSLKNVSTRLGYLTERELIKCLNPHEKRGRLYVITNRGKKALKKIEDMK